MINTKIFDSENKLSESKKNEIIDFLHINLEEYGDKKEDIKKAINYALKDFNSFGGFVMILNEDNIIKGAVVMNYTGMGGYIPENILVYISTHKDFRGQGLGKKLMNDVIEYTKGDIALHVEANNPAKYLYEKHGFTNPYLEMRLKK